MYVICTVCMVCTHLIRERILNTDVNSQINNILWRSKYTGMVGKINGVCERFITKRKEQFINTPVLPINNTQIETAVNTKQKICRLKDNS